MMNCPEGKSISHLGSGPRLKEPSPQKKVRVLHIVTRLNIGGVAKHVISLCSSLDPTKFDVTLVTGQESQLEGSMLDLALKKGIRVIKITELQREIRPFSDLVAFRKLILLMHRHKPDIVHTHTSKAGLLGRLAAKLAGVRITIHTFHGHIFEGYFSRSKTKLFLLLERLWALYTNRILAVNRLIFRDLKSLGIGNGKCEVIENGFELENYIKTGRFEGSFRHELGLTPNHVLIGAVGRLVPVKGYTYLIDGAADLLKNNSDARLVFVGDGELKKILKDKVVSLGIDRQVLFIGFREDMEKVYSDLNLLVLPSLNEGLPTVLIEALCAGVPVVATKVGAIPDLIDDSSGMVVEPKDPKTLTSAIQQMLRDPFRSLTMEMRREYYERFGSKRFIKDVERLYFELSPNHS